MALKLYCSNICEKCKRVRAFMEEEGIDNVEIVDASKDIGLMKEIQELGGKMEVPMLYDGKEAIYGEDEIKARLK